MSAFLALALVLIGRRTPFFIRNGFYILVLFYAAQRFFWEFLKPYGTLIGPLNLFHLVSASLICYSLVMMGKADGRAAS